MPEVFESVMRELRALLNTRLPVGPGPNPAHPGAETVINYGLPDFSRLNAVSPSDREMLARLIERKVEAFEPRLKHVFVSLEPDPQERGAVVGTMQATLHAESIHEPVTFRLAHGKHGVTLMESEPVEPASQTNANR
jgi:type VI secretion system lysozyme-like protein